MTPTILSLPMSHHQPTMNYHHHMGRQTRKTINICIYILVIIYLFQTSKQDNNKT